MEQENIMDVIQETDGQYIQPSIGRIGEIYYDERNNRIKLFSTQIHTSIDSIESQTEQSLQALRSYHATRFMGRFITNRDVILAMDPDNLITPNIEAIVPLSGIFRGHFLLYVGLITSERRDEPSVLNQETEMLKDIMAQPRRRQLAIPATYTVEHLRPENTSRNTIDQLVHLYHQAFRTYTADLNHDAISNMIANSTVYVVNHNDDIVSSVVAEVSTVPTSMGDFRLSELSEMATLREHRGHGLVTYATRQLLEQLDADLIYAEARACHRAINQSFYNLGFFHAGRLQKQCILSGDHEIAEAGPYENLNVWYLPSEE